MQSDNIPRDLKVSAEMLKLRLSFGHEIETRLTFKSPKIRRYFERAFVRWIFLSVMKGLNPFKDLICAEDFVSHSDVLYFAKKYQCERDFLFFSWSWLTDKLKIIHQIPIVKSKEMVCATIVGTNVILTLDNISQTMPLSMYERSIKLYRGKKKTKNLLILTLLSRYNACGTTNNHCSVPPTLISFCDITTELFGSPFNTCAEQYCSPFPDIEAFFGSLGSFFDPHLTFSTGTYLFNPPYDEVIILNGVKRILSALETKIEMTVVMIIPVWDAENQKNIQGKERFNTKFEALDVIKSSKYVKSKMVLDFSTHPFFNYYTNSYVKVTDTHLIILSNTQTRLHVTDISHYWSKITAN